MRRDDAYLLDTVEAVPAPMVKSIDEIVDPHPHPLPKGEGPNSPLPSGKSMPSSPLPTDKGASLSSPLPPGEGGRRPGEGKPSINPKLLARARKLRTEQTDAEQLLWHLLRNRQFCGIKFRRQHPVDPYVLDFYDHEEQSGIELDGGQHNEPERKRRDKERTTFFESKGIRVIRFWNHEVLQETEAVLERLYHFLFPPLTPALSQRERENKSNTPLLTEGVPQANSPLPLVKGVVPSSALPPGEGGRRPGEGNEVIADQSIARSGETRRQEEWRDELQQTGIRGKSSSSLPFSLTPKPPSMGASQSKS